MQTIKVSYKVQTEKFRNAWNTGIESNKEAKKAMNEMVRILLEEHKEWSIRQALMTIATEHSDLEGMNIRSMYRHLTDENRAMLQDKDVDEGKPKLPKKDMKQSDIPSSSNQQGGFVDQNEKVDETKVWKPGQSRQQLAEDKLKGVDTEEEEDEKDRIHLKEIQLKDEEIRSLTSQLSETRKLVLDQSVKRASEIAAEGEKFELVVDRINVEHFSSVDLIIGTVQSQIIAPLKNRQWKRAEWWLKWLPDK